MVKQNFFAKWVGEVFWAADGKFSPAKRSEAPLSSHDVTIGLWSKKERNHVHGFGPHQ